MHKILAFFKAAYRYATSKPIRIIIALCFLAVFIGILAYIIYVDFYIERWRRPFNISISPIDYHLRFQSIDFENRIVRGSLKLRFRPNLFDVDSKDEIKYRFGPLVYADGISLFSGWGLKSSWMINLKVSQLAKTTEFKAHKPAAVPFESELIGEPKAYPFDAYLLVGAVKCVIKDDPEGASETLKRKRREDITVSQNIPGFLIRYARFDEVERFGPWPMQLTDKTIKVETSDYKEWNRKNVFLLVLERPLFLRFMTIFLGVVACFSVLYIVFWRPVKDIPVNGMGYFIALWAIREILYRGTTAFPTLIDYGVLFLYACLVVGGICRWIWPRNASSVS